MGKIVAKHFLVAVWGASHADVLLARHVILTKERVTKPWKRIRGGLQSWVLTKPVDLELFHWKNVTWVLLPFNLLNCSFHFHPFLFFSFLSFPFYRKSIECNLTDLSGISLSEVEEGNEPDEFWKAIGGKKYYCSLAHGKYVLPPPLPSLPSSISNSSLSLELIFI